MRLDQLTILEIFSKLDNHLSKKVEIVVIGSTVPILLGQPLRTTNGIDVWLPDSKIDNMEDFINACKNSNLSVFTPLAEFFCDAEMIAKPYIRLLTEYSSISVMVIEIGKYDRKQFLILYNGNKLKVLSLPLVNLIASKLLRATINDINDCIFLIRKYGIDQGQIKDVIKTFKNPTNRKIVKENMAILEASGVFDYKRQPHPRNIFLMEKSKDAKIAKKNDVKFYRQFTPEDYAQAKERWVNLINFLISDRDPAELVKEKNIVLLHDLIHFIRNGLPSYEMALHDPALFKRLRDRVTELVLKGWF